MPRPNFSRALPSRPTRTRTYRGNWHEMPDHDPDENDREDHDYDDTPEPPALRKNYIDTTNS